jgi:hypothetical protein
MTIEHLHQTSAAYLDDSIVLIHSFTGPELGEFAYQVRELAENSLPFKLKYRSDERCADLVLRFALSNEDLGIQEDDDNSLTCELTHFGYTNMLELVSAFASQEEMTGFQYLYDLTGDIELIISKNGRW